MLPPLFPERALRAGSARTHNQETLMLGWTFRISCVLVLTLSASFVLAQAEFSAEIMDSHKQGTTTQPKIYFSKDKIRFDSRDANSPGAFIMNLSNQTMTILMPQQHMYMEMPADAQEQRNMFSFFKTSDVENACGDWLKLATNKGGSCHKLGSESVNGRSTVKYEGTNSKGEASQVWLDPKLRFPVKWQGASGSGELRNIQEGTQPASLFAIPDGYTKMDMGGGMARH
jgi:hypothetical protein